jgi:hypothetical protein
MLFHVHSAQEDDKLFFDIFRLTDPCRMRLSAILGLQPVQVALHTHWQIIIPGKLQFPQN